MKHESCNFVQFLGVARRGHGGIGGKGDCGGEGDSKGGGGGAAGGGGNGAGGVRRRRSDVLSCYCHLAGRRVRADGPRSTEISRDQPRSAEITTEVVVALAPAHRAVPRPPPWSAPTA